MTLDRLVARACYLLKCDENIIDVSVLEVTRIVLKGDLDAESSTRNIKNLSQQIARKLKADADFFSEWDFYAEANGKTRQTGGGKVVIRKSEHRAG